MENTNYSKLFPDYLEVTSVQEITHRITISLTSTNKKCSCPGCGVDSDKVSTYYHRKLQDKPIGLKPTTLQLGLKKFKCLNPNCETKVFSEDISDFVAFKRQKTLRYFEEKNTNES